MKEIALTIMPVFWPNMPPLGLAALKGFLKQNGIETSCIDFNNHFYSKLPQTIKIEWHKSCNLTLEENIFNIIEKECPEEFTCMIEKLSSFSFVAMSVYKSNLTTSVKVSERIKKINPGIKIIFGGPEIARRYFDENDSILERFENIADYLIIGEGEKPILKYLNGHTSSRIALYDEISGPEEFSVPDFSDFDFSKYPKQNAISVIYSRGCVKRCSFCAERLLYKKYRTYGIENVLTQIKNGMDEGIKQFIFHDSLINGDLGLLDNLCQGIIKEFGSVDWEAQIAVRNDMPDGIFKKMKESGCYHLFVGLESGSDPVLKKMNKGFNASDALLFFKILNAHNLSFGVSMIVGFPGETIEEFRQSLDFLIENKELVSKIEQVNPFVYYNGIDLPKDADYKKNEESLERAKLFIKKIDEAGFKYTKSFMLNLVEPSWK